MIPYYEHAGITFYHGFMVECDYDGCERAGETVSSEETRRGCPVSNARPKTRFQAIRRSHSQAHQMGRKPSGMDGEKYFRQRRQKPSASEVSGYWPMLAVRCEQIRKAPHRRRHQQQPRIEYRRAVPFMPHEVGWEAR